MNANDVDIEKGAALAAALKELFRQYPIPLPGRGYLHIWRNDAIQCALRGYTTSAISSARNTGVPHDVLTALEMLLDE